MRLLISILLFLGQHLSFFVLDHTSDVLSQFPTKTPAATTQYTPPPIATPLIRNPDVQIPAQLKEIRHGNKEKPLIALTFDDGFEPEPSITMLNTLKEKGVQATFFLKGNWIVNHQDIVARIIEDGHELGNHSYNHPHFSKISTSKAREEVNSQESLLRTQNNYSPKPYFRFPYGDRTPAMLNLINDAGYISVLWDVDTLDWLRDAPTIEKTAVEEAHNGAIILMHLGKADTAKVLPNIIDKLREKGFTLVTVSQLIAADNGI